MENKSTNNKLFPIKTVKALKDSRFNTPSKSGRISGSPYSSKQHSPNAANHRLSFKYNMGNQYQQKIAHLQNTIRSLQKLNKTITQDAKSNQSQLQYLLQCTKQQLNKKTNKVCFLQETLSKMNIRMLQNSSHKKLCQSSRSRASTNRRNTQQNLSKSKEKLPLVQSQSHEKNEIIVFELRNQLEKMKALVDEQKAQITQFKQNLKSKQQIIKKKEEQYETLKKDIQNKVKQYQNIINEKQSTIRKMAQFNDNICCKLMQQTSNALSNSQKKKLELLVHDNKALKEMCYQLQNKNLELEEDISNFVQKCKDMKAIRQEILLIIENQKKTIAKKNMEIQSLKYQILQFKKQSDKETRNSRVILKDAVYHSKNYSSNIKIKKAEESGELQIQQFQSTCDNESGQQRQKNLELFQQNFQKFRNLYKYVTKNQIIQEQDQPFSNRLLYANPQENSHVSLGSGSSPRFNVNPKTGSKADIVKKSQEVKKRSQSIKDPQNLTFAFDDTIQLADDSDEN